jgi:type VI secretion system protein VasL
MIPYVYAFSPLKLKINGHDPRCHQSFLLLSSDMSHWKKHINDNNWWMEREIQCLGVFRQYGYDLQSGGWYCLIACQRSGWQGLAGATLMLANGFAKQHKPCWPPLVAQDLRRQILDWYCTQLLPVIYTQPLATGDISHLQQLRNAIELLQNYAATIYSSQQGTLKQLGVWLDSTIRVNGQPGGPVSTVVSAPSSIRFLPPVVSVRWRDKIFWWLSSVVVALLSVTVIMGSREPAVLVYSNKIWPENMFFTHWRQQLQEKSNVLVADMSYRQLNEQLDTLERRLIGAEKNRKSYVTISELKTAIYHMRQSVRQQEMTLEYQLNTLQELRVNQQRVSPALLSSLSLQLDALNSRFLLLSSDESVSAGRH